MSTEAAVVSLRARVTELEARLEHLYRHLGIAFAANPAAVNAPVIALLKAGDKMEAIKTYRAIHNSGLAESKEAVERMEKAL